MQAAPRGALHTRVNAGVRWRGALWLRPRHARVAPAQGGVPRSSRPAGRHGEVLSEHDTGGTKMRESVMHTLKAGVLYFTLVFGAGFVLGPMRILCLVPRVGTRTAELMEMPMMLAWSCSRRGGSFGASPCPPDRRHGLASAVSRLAGCWSQNSPLCFG
jgi:hypothetical protein